ncbi:hypothetical protein GGR51DRAFT_501041 [Nemania sp. FL0031]|nr:hypothetical protein GGR51DRAFT_501041 [Nemania sp. FL0031]
MAIKHDAGGELAPSGSPSRQVPVDVKKRTSRAVDADPPPSNRRRGAQPPINGALQGDQSKWRWSCPSCGFQNLSYNYDTSCPSCGYRRDHNCNIWSQ